MSNEKSIANLCPCGNVKILASDPYCHPCMVDRIGILKKKLEEAEALSWARWCAIESLCHELGKTPMEMGFAFWKQMALDNIEKKLEIERTGNET